MEAEREVVKIFPVSDLGTAFFRLQLLLTASSGHCRVQRAHQGNFLFTVFTNCFVFKIYFRHDQ